MLNDEGIARNGPDNGLRLGGIGGTPMEFRQPVYQLHQFSELGSPLWIIGPAPHHNLLKRVNAYQHFSAPSTSSFSN